MTLPRPILLLLVVAGLAFTGCGDGHDHGPGHDHGHAEASHDEPRSNAVTVWAERHELFVEYRLPVAGAPVKFIAHVTDMLKMQPRIEGSIVLVFRQGSESIEHDAPAPARAGIYLPEISFPRAGPWSWSVKIPQEGREWLVELPPVTVYASQAEIDALSAEGYTEHGISFLKEQQWKIPFRSSPVKKRTLVQRIRLPGEAAVPPWGRASVAAPIDGELKPPGDGVLPRVGDRVEKGQILGYIEPHFSVSDLLGIEGQRLQVEAQARELLVKVAEVEAGEIRARVRLEQAEKLLARVRQLAAEGARSQRELEEGEFEVRSAKAELEGAAAVKKVYADTVKKMGERGVLDVRDAFPPVEMRAPISGEVTAVESAEGAHIEHGVRLFMILDTSRMRIQARLPESDLGRVAVGMPATGWSVDARGEFFDLGKAVRIEPEVDGETRTLGVTFEAVNNSGRLRSGLAVTVLIETRRSAEALAIPESAILDEDGKSIAFVHVSGETCERRDLVLGIRDAGWVEVISGIEEGERVVTIGALAVRLSSMSSTIPAHGHAH